MSDLKITRHIGRVINSDNRLAILFLQVPNEPYKCLAVNLDALNDRYAGAIKEALYSDQGQNTENLGDYLGTIRFNGAPHSLIAELHIKNVIQKMNVEMIEMLPRPGMPHNLAELLVEMGRLDKDLAETLLKRKLITKIDPNEILKNINANKDALKTDNIYEMNIKNANEETKMNQARFLLNQAEDLDHQAFLKRQQAYAIVPALDPAKSHIRESLENSVVSKDVEIDLASNNTRKIDQVNEQEYYQPNPVTGLSQKDLGAINTPTKEQPLTAHQIMELMNKNNHPTGLPKAAISEGEPNPKMVNALADLFSGNITKDAFDAIAKETVVPTRMEQISGENNG
jgi:hypothetical protein